MSLSAPPHSQGAGRKRFLVPPVQNIKSDTPCLSTVMPPQLNSVTPGLCDSATNRKSLQREHPLMSSMAFLHHVCLRKFGHGQKMASHL
jgi:hypothetical protein